MCGRGVGDPGPSTTPSLLQPCDTLRGAGGTWLPGPEWLLQPQGLTGCRPGWRARAGQWGKLEETLQCVDGHQEGLGLKGFWVVLPGRGEALVEDPQQPSPRSCRRLPPPLPLLAGGGASQEPLRQAQNRGEAPLKQNKVWPLIPPLYEVFGIPTARTAGCSLPGSPRDFTHRRPGP